MSLEEKLQQASGAAKEVLGKVTGDKSTETEGTVEKELAKAKEVLENIFCRPHIHRAIWQGIHLYFRSCESLNVFDNQAFIGEYRYVAYRFEGAVCYLSCHKNFFDIAWDIHFAVEDPFECCCFVFHFHCHSSLFVWTIIASSS